MGYTHPILTRTFRKRRMLKRPYGSVLVPQDTRKHPYNFYTENRVRLKSVIRPLECCSSSQFLDGWDRV